MELKQLKHFVALANNCHVSKTAYQLNISQPALSKSIIQLEKELGIKLFDRMGKKMVLSKSGERFFPMWKNRLPC